MADFSSRLWSKIHEFVMEMGSQPDREALSRMILARINDLIPWDNSVDLFSEPRHCVEVCGASEKIVYLYNSFYAPLNPVISEKLASETWVDWRKFGATQFCADFIQPLGIGYTLSCFISFERPWAIAIQRSSKEPVFKERDYRILKVITPHLNNIYSYLTTISRLEAKHFQAAEAAKDCRLLSRRETEVTALLCQRLTVPEIATKLLISPNTVQRHIVNIYGKLKVRTRRELLLKVMKSQ